MTRFGSVQDFLKRHEELKSRIDPNRKMITICGGTGCTAFGSPVVREAFEQELDRRHLGKMITVKVTGCHGFCEKGPVVVILPSKVFYPSVQVEDVPRIVEKTGEGALLSYRYASSEISFAEFPR
jgi:NADH-quinone oxidoreductase subunit F